MLMCFQTRIADAVVPPSPVCARQAKTTEETQNYSMKYITFKDDLPAAPTEVRRN